MRIGTVASTIVRVAVMHEGRVPRQASFRMLPAHRAEYVTLGRVFALRQDAARPEIIVIAP